MHIKDFILLVLKVSLSNKITKQSTLLNFKKPEREREERERGGGAYALVLLGGIECWNIFIAV